MRSTKFDNSFVSSLLIGSGKDWTIFFGTPIRTNAIWINSTTLEHTLAPLGDGARIIAFLHFRALITLFRGVAIGFVDGTMAPITPIGLAISTSPFCKFSSIMPTVLIPFKSLKSPIVLRLFFRFLSSTFPRPV